VRELERPPDDARTTVEDTRTHRIGHLDDVFAVHSTDASIDRRRIEPVRPRRSIAPFERVGHRVAKTRRHGARRLAAATLTGPSLPATRMASRKKKNRPHWAAGR